jgi:co-chaperonin GroES (HSP10)
MGPRFVVERAIGAHFTRGGLYVPVPDSGHSYVGTVLYRGTATEKNGRRLPLELIGSGQAVLYSSRCDTFEVDGFPGPIDVVEEASIIGIL